MKGILLVSFALAAASPVCLGQTNSPAISLPANAPAVMALSAVAHPGSRAEASRAPGHSDGFWEDAANVYWVGAAHPLGSVRAGAPQADVSGQMSLEGGEIAVFRRIEREGLLQTRESIREARHSRDLEGKMDAACRRPESFIWGTSIDATRFAGTASGVP